MLIKAVARNLWRTGEVPRYATWYEPLDDQVAIDAAVAFALSRTTATGIATPGDVRLLPLVIEAERRAGAATEGEVAAALEAVPGVASPFVRTPGRSVPDWLETVVQDP
jgi:hypothetical protein